MHCELKEEVKRMSEKLYGVDQFYPGDFAPILTGVYSKPRNRITARKVLDSAPYIIYRFAEDFGMQDSFISALDGFTNIREAARRIVILAPRSMTGSYGSINIHTGIHDGSVKEERDLMDLVGSLDPDIISTLERSLSGRIVKSFGSSGIVYDLSAIRYFGSCNDLAGYGHYDHY